LRSVMLAILKENYQSLFLFKSAMRQVELCLFITVGLIVMAISRAHSFRQISLIFFGNIVSLFSYVMKPTIVDHLSVSAKFREIPRKYQNSTKKGKFHGSAQNSVTCGKLWALLINT